MLKLKLNNVSYFSIYSDAYSKICQLADTRNSGHLHAGTLSSCTRSYYSRRLEAIFEYYLYTQEGSMKFGSRLASTLSFTNITADKTQCQLK